MAKIEPIIYLDMDGVCTDFAAAGIRVNGYRPEEILVRWENNFKEEFFPYIVMGIDRDDYWQAIAAQGETFWYNLEAYPWFEKLYTSLCQIAPVIFLSSSTRTPSCLSGKLKWLQARFGPAFQDYIFTAHKQQLANPGALLIDDYEVNVNKFKQAGGNSILFPQIWNSNHHIDDKLAYTIKQTDRWYQSVAEL
jgi:5'(3')-deoxyribonucleotidase